MNFTEATLPAKSPLTGCVCDRETTWGQWSAKKMDNEEEDDEEEEDERTRKTRRTRRQRTTRRTSAS